jgi:GTPase SAR1 family protein
MSSNLDKAIELRSKCEHFRILVIGRANAGKTTLLKKVCDSKVDPEIFSPSGEKVMLPALSRQIALSCRRSILQLSTDRRWFAFLYRAS